MSKPQVIEQEPISIVELKATLSKIKKRDEELSFRAEKTDEYAQAFARLSQAKAKELKKALEELDIPRFTAEDIVKLIDILPTTEEDVKLTLQASTASVTKENIKKIAEIVADHA